MEGKARTLKNKVAPPHRNCNLKVFFDRGFDKLSDLEKIFLKELVIYREGNTYYQTSDTKKEKLATSKEKFEERLQNDTELLNKLFEELKEKRDNK